MYNNNNEYLNNLLIECDNIKHAMNDINRWLDVFGKQGYNWEHDKDMAHYLNRLELAIVFAKLDMETLKDECNKTKWVEY